MSEPRIRVTGRLIGGLIIIALGAIFTLDNFDVLDAKEVLKWWPIIPLTFGLIRLTGIGGQSRPIIGALFTFGGGWLLLYNLGVVPYDLWDFWPLILILLGGSMIARAMRSPVVSSGGGEASPTVNAFALWSGVVRKVTSSDFQGGELTAIMGGHQIDLRGAKATSGRVVLDLFVLMGGIDLRVPEDWSVSCEGMVLMGGIEDRSRVNGDPKTVLVLKGLVMMGGVEVKN